MAQTIAVVLVTHNSQAVLARCLAALNKQTVQADAIIIVDSGSTDKNYLQSYQEQHGLRVLFQENIGFSRANNLGWRAIHQQTDFVLFLNPDAFPAPDSFERALAFLNKNPAVACVGGRLSGFAIATKQASGLLDSTGVFRKWFGRWTGKI